MRNRYRQISNQWTAYFEDVSQSFFFRNAYFGFVLLLLLLAFDPHYFVCATVASLIGYGYTLQYSTPKILKDSGLITINGFFFGLAMASLFKESQAAYLCLLLGALSIPLATKATYEVLQHWKLSVFVFPYILSIWVIWLCGTELGLELRRDIWPEVLSTLPPLHPGWSFLHVTVMSLFHGVGRLLFLPNPAFGLFVLALITLFSPRKGFFFLLGTALASFMAFILSSSTSSAWEYGFYSYSGGLVGLGLAACPEKINWKTILLFCILSCFLTMAADQFLRGLKLPLLSLPYVLAMWVAILSRTPRVNMSWAQAKPIPLQASQFAKSRETPEKVA